jgi:hypothetical protein
MSQTIVESQTATYTVLPGETYVFSPAGTWDSMTGTLKWSDGITDVDIQTFTADGAVEVIAPTTTLKFVTGADGTNAGSLLVSLYKKLSFEDSDMFPNGREVGATIA